jgi:hypothetical protein
MAKDIRFFADGTMEIHDEAKSKLPFPDARMEQCSICGRMLEERGCPMHFSRIPVRLQQAWQDEEQDGYPPEITDEERGVIRDLNAF